MPKRKRYASEHKFAKLAALRAENSPESRKEMRRMSETWTSRSNRSISGFYVKQQPGICYSINP